MHIHFSQEAQLRADMAAAFHIAAFMDWHEGVANHFSVALSEDGQHFLMNPKWRHFSRMRDGDLLRLDGHDRSTLEHADAPDPTAWYLHGTLHAKLPHIRCLMHLHLPYATAIACLQNPQLLAIDQTTARFFRRIAIDTCYGGMVDNTSESERMVQLLSKHPIVMMGNHGVLVSGPSIAQAFDTMYHLERACRTLVLAYSTGQPLRVLDDAVAESTAQDWERYSDSAEVHFAEMQKVLMARGACWTSTP